MASYLKGKRMKQTPRLGLQAEQVIVVGPENRISFADARMPAVLATPWLIAHLEYATPHWGGRDGTPHLPLTWEALLLIDSAPPGPMGPHSILVASPFYVLDR